jgi:hypothetical protein
MELVAILLSFVALVISLIALYLTSLRPAEVEIDHVPRDDELPTGRFSGPRPADHDLFLGSCRTQERAAVAWRFTRTAGLPVASRWLPRWLRSRRESVERSIRVEVDARHYRDWCIERWRTYEAWNHLADIAERAARGDQPTAWPGG